MFNGTQIMSLKKVREYCTKDNENLSVIISISNSFEMPPKLNKTVQNNVKDILYLSFDDVYKSELTRDETYPHIWLDRTGRAVSPITEKDAEKIHSFVMKYYKSSNIYTLIVHCEMGVSRSAGVMAAIKKALYDNDKDIFNNGAYRPNPDVYREVLNKFMDYAIEDKMDIDDVHNLRFGFNRTPYKYNPFFWFMKYPHDSVYVPNAEICERIEGLQDIKEVISTQCGTHLPFYRFNFAIRGRNKELKKNIFIGKFSIDKDFFRETENDATYKQSFSYKLTQEYNKNPIPDITVECKTEKINGIEYEVIYYYILLYNKNSPYFYQKSFSFDNKENCNPEEVIFEVEYSFPDGYKTWAYCTLTKEEVKRAVKNVGFSDVVNFTSFINVASENYNIFLANEANEQGLITTNMQSYFNKDYDASKKDDVYAYILAENQDGISAVINFSYEDWQNYCMNNCISCIRIVNF